MTTESRKPGVFVKTAHHENNNNNDDNNKKNNPKFRGKNLGYCYSSVVLKNGSNFPMNMSVKHVS